MLIHDFTYVHAPFDVVRQRLAAGAEAWLTPLAARAGDAGQALGIRIGPAGDVSMLSRTTRVCVGEATARGGLVLIPMTWEAEEMTGAALNRVSGAWRGRRRRARAPAPRRRLRRRRGGR